MDPLNALLQQFAKTAADLAWTGVRGQTQLMVHKADGGVDVARGPWIEFVFDEPGNKNGRTIKGFFLWAGGDRVQLDGSEADHDYANVSVNNGALVATLSGSLTENGQVYPFSYVFTGKPKL